MGNVIDFDNLSGIEAEAVNWIVRLDRNKPTDEELGELAAWIAQSSRHRTLIVEMSEQWGELDQLTDLLAVAEPQSRLARRPRRRIFRTGIAARGLAFAATILLAVSAVVFVGTSFFERGPSVYKTAIGEQKRVLLSDGSIVRINTNTVLQVKFADDERRVVLESGEALFEVAKDASRPFVVAAGTSEIVAIGTAFSVRFEYDTVEVTVSEGVVDFQAPTLLANTTQESGTRVKSEKLVALESIEYNQGNAVVTKLEQEEMARALAWRDGALAFRGEPLDYVVAEVGRYSEIEFVFEDDSLRDLRVGGYFGIGETDNLLIALEEGFGVYASRNPDGKILLSRSRTN